MSEAAVCAALKTISPNKACGTDHISARGVIERTEETATPRTKILHSSVVSGVFPEKWKQADIVPFFNKWDNKLSLNVASATVH